MGDFRAPRTFLFLPTPSPRAPTSPANKTATPLPQLFLGHGQNWCGNMRPAELRRRARTDPHFALAVPGERSGAQYACVWSKLLAAKRANP
jgi:hypothetical protein